MIIFWVWGRSRWLTAFSQHAWDTVIHKKIIILWGKEFMMPDFLWVFVPRLISCLCQTRCRLRGGFLILFPFVDTVMWNDIAENTGLIPLPDFPSWQKVHTVETSALSSHLTEIMQLIQRLHFGGQVVWDHLTYKIISSGNKIKDFEIHNDSAPSALLNSTICARTCQCYVNIVVIWKEACASFVTNLLIAEERGRKC